MSTPDLISERDLRQLFAVIENGRRDAPGPAIPWAVLDGLAALISCDEVGFCELDLSRRWRPVSQSVFSGGFREVELGPEYDPDADQLYWDLNRGFQGCHRDQHAARPAGVVRWSDMYSPAELLEQPLYSEFFRPGGVKHCMYVELPALPGHTRRLLFWRWSGSDFSDRDKLVLEVLRPHLYEVYQDARHRREDMPRLTPREWQVLELAAQGHSNAEIAGLLVTSVSTVRKHMEHIFDHTGVRSRSAVIAQLIR